jgi:hypothetical protein
MRRGGADATGSILGHVDLIKQYPGEQQVRLKVEIEVPGSWFGGTHAGGLTATERRETFTAQAAEYAAVHEFKGIGRARGTKEPGIRFICIDDAVDEPSSDGYWMKLSEWNRYRHHTYKDRRNDELPFLIGAELQAAVGQPDAAGGEAASGGGRAPEEASNLSEPERVLAPFFKLVGTGTHIPNKGKDNEGKPVTAHHYRCLTVGCKSKQPCAKETGKSTGQRYRHLKKCNHDAWLSALPFSAVCMHVAS